MTESGETLKPEKQSAFRSRKKGGEDYYEYHYRRRDSGKGISGSLYSCRDQYQGRTDMAMVYSEVPCKAAGTFTTNIVKAAPVKWDQDIVTISRRLR